MKLAVKVIISCLIVIIVGILCVYHFVTYTPYGRLDFSSGLILKVANLFGDDRSVYDYTPQEFRNHLDGIILRYRGKLIELPRVEDKKVSWTNGDIPIRIYTPVMTQNLPVVIFFHGGGWFSGSIETHENFCRRLAKATSAIVISVGYSLAPEAKFPTPIEEGYAVLEWVKKNAASLNADADKIVVAGDSAGGTIATALCMKSRDIKGPAIRLQVLFYPATDLVNLDTPSRQKFGEGYLFSKELPSWIRSQYFSNKEDYKHPYASPLLADNLSDLPPCLIFTAQFDPLCSGGEAYAEKLKEAGNDCQYILTKGVLHGFASMGSQKAKDAFKIVAQKISEI